MKITKKWKDKENVIQQNEIKEYIKDYFIDHPYEKARCSSMTEDELMDYLGFSLAE